MAKIKTIELSELTPVRKPRKPSERQMALIEREAQYAKAINKLEPGKAVQFSPEENEKVPTLRASLQRVIDRSDRRPELHLAIINGVAYVALGPIPGARRPRSRAKKGAEATNARQ